MIKLYHAEKKVQHRRNSWIALSCDIKIIISHCSEIMLGLRFLPYHAQKKNIYEPIYIRQFSTKAYLNITYRSIIHLWRNSNHLNSYKLSLIYLLCSSSSQSFTSECFSCANRVRFKNYMQIRNALGSINVHDEELHNKNINGIL